MNPATIADAIETRIKADTTLWSGTAWLAPLAGGFTFVEDEASSAVYPYIVCGVECGDFQHAFTGMNCTAIVTFRIVDGRMLTPSAPGIARVGSLINRIVGDAMLSTGTSTVPTYGFHNHNLVLPVDATANVQGLSATNMTLDGSATLEPGATPRTLVAVLAFAVQVSNIAVNPTP